MSNVSVNAIRFLGIDAIEKAKSGHPGIVMGAAPMAYGLYTRHLTVNPNEPTWINRDRFVLSAGHGSMLVYALLHLSGYQDVRIEDIKQFRQLHSKTPGHPEYGHTQGIDATSGPLGQGLSMAVGMAMAERFLAAKFNQKDFPIFDHYTYAIVGDGDLMEGVTSETSSFAGQQKLSKLIVLYDSNNICLDGETKDTFTENVRQRYEAYGWDTQLVEDGNDVGAIVNAIEKAKQSDKPSLIEVKTVIGYGSVNKAGKNSAHGSPLGEEEVQLTRKALDYPYAPFEIPESVYDDFRVNVKERGVASYNKWCELVEKYASVYPEVYAQLSQILKGKDPVKVKMEDFVNYESGTSKATRNASFDAINAAAKVMPNLLGGSADLAHSNMTMISTDTLQDNGHRQQRNIQFGVREFGMSTVLNGMSLHGGLRVFGGTFFVFSDYLKAGIRLSALQQLPVTYVLTHDSIAVGEDGPTHEPIEHLAGLRAIPNLNVIRPCDARETQGAWYSALTSEKTPTALILSRQNLTVEATSTQEGVLKGAYIVYENSEYPEVIVIASGSEVNLAVSAAKEITDRKIRVISMPSMELFEQQTQAYKNEILPPSIRKRLAIEMGSTSPWYRYVGLDGYVLGIDTFGASAPAKEVLKEYGFTVENVKNIISKL